jgi:hypothetical protein
MKKVIFYSLLALLSVGCSKGKYETKPQITVTSVTPDPVPLGSSVRITLECTDKEGDVADSIYIIRERLNVKNPRTQAALIYKIPDFPSAPKIDIQVDLDYSKDLTIQIPAIRIPGSNPLRNEPDTMRLKFVAVDKAENRSDTAVTSFIVIR